MEREDKEDLKIKEQKRYNVFVIIWAIAGIFHMAHSNIFTDTLDNTLLTISIALLIFNPSLLIKLLFFLTMHLCVTFRYMPNVSNHEIFYALANLTILQSVAYQCYKQRTFNIDTNAIYRSFAPVVRIELVIFYFYVVFHKLNADFFNIIVSCGTKFYNEENFFHLLPVSDNIYLANAYFTVLIEAIIPLLLCFKRTRNVGLFVGLIFHTIISYNLLNRFFDISASIFAAYVLFMDFEFSAIWYKHYNRVKIFLKSFKQQPFNAINFFIACLIFITVASSIFIFSKWIESHAWYKVWTVLCFSFLYVFIKSIQKTVLMNHVKDLFTMPHYTFYLIPVVIFFNGLCPYLGLKTDYSFSMFSNLRTEGGRTNHYLIPISSQIFDYQKDIVEIISSTQPEIRRFRKKNELLTFFSLNNLVHKLHPDKIEYLRNGKRFNYDSKKPFAQGDLKEENPYILKKLLRFRSIKNSEDQDCSH